MDTIVDNSSSNVCWLWTNRELGMRKRVHLLGRIGGVVCFVQDIETAEILTVARDMLETIQPEVAVDPGIQPS